MQQFSTMFVLVLPSNGGPGLVGAWPRGGAWAGEGPGLGAGPGLGTRLEGGLGWGGWPAAKVE